MKKKTNKASETPSADLGSARERFLALSLASTRKSYYPQLMEQLELAKDSESRLRSIFDKLPARISYIDDKENFVFINLEWAKGYGFDRDKIVGRKVRDVIGEENYSNLSSYLKRAGKGERVHFESPFMTRDGRWRWLDLFYVPETDEKGKVVGFFALSIDRTERKQMEEEKASLESRLHQAQKMEAIGTLAGGIAHDFNNILSGIFGYSQLAEAHINSPEQARNYIRKIFDGAQRASLLIQQILTFSRHSDDNRQPLKISVPLKEALKMLRSTIPKSIEIKEQIISKARVMADATQIHQVIMNLCTNAYHAMGDSGGILTVSLKDMDASIERFEENLNPDQTHFIRLEVSDTGPGIPSRIQNRIFEPYFTTKEVGKGTGLGLAVVDGIVKKHNGFIRVQSDPGKGTSFFVFLPVIESFGTSEGISKSELRLSEGTEHILLADDEPDIRDSVTAMLENLGYRVTACENGEQALETFKRAPEAYDLIVTDMTMPVMTGDRLSEEILKIRGDMLIILCTGYHESFTKEAALAAGIRAYVEKPVSGLQLSCVIRDLLDNPVKVT